MDARRPVSAVRSSSAARRLAPFALLLGAALAFVGCSKPEEPVARVEVQPETTSLPFPRSADLELTWDLRSDIDTTGAGPTVFIHLLSADGQILRTFDHPFPQGWHEGGEVSYPLPLYQSMLAPPLPAGRYRLTLGLYEGDRRWPLDAGEEIGHMEYVVARVDVPASQPGELPTVEYTGAWTPLLAGADRQVLGYRLLRGEGQVKVGAAGAGGTLGMVFELADLQPGQRRVMDDSGEVPSLRVSSTCDGSQRTLSGDGPVKLAIQVSAGGDCTVDVSPNFHFSGLDADAAAEGDEAAEEPPALARLTVVTWDPA